MKFNLEETVTGADLSPGLVLLKVPRNQFVVLLERLEENSIPVEGLLGDLEQGMAVVRGDLSPYAEALRSIPGLALEPEYFRLTLRGHRLYGETGLGKLWNSLLADRGISPVLSDASSGGITQYFPEAARELVLTLLKSTFGILAV